MSPQTFFARLSLLLLLSLVSGCSAAPHYAQAPSSLAGQLAKETVPGEYRPDRMLVCHADLTLEVGNVKEAQEKGERIANQHGGFVEWKSDTDEQSARLRIRVPFKNFTTAIKSLESLGSVESRSVVGEDVTERYIDVEARLKNNIALRDRLRQLLDKATAVQDIVAIEKELTRVQAEIDSQEGQIKSLKGKADFATIDLNLKRKKILGPLGYVFTGLWWGISKLFVLRN